MSILDLLDSLRASGVHLWVEQGRLRFRGAAEVMTPELRATLSARRDEIIALLRQADAAEQPLRQPIPAAPRETALPLSFAQERLWFLHQWDPGASAYNLPLLVRLEGRLDSAALAQALSAVVARHEILRTTFAAPGGRPVQRIHPPQPVPLEQIDLRDLPPGRSAEAARQRISAAAGLPFDLEGGPLLRALLLREADSAHLLLLNLHHSIVDGWSLHILVRELAACYQAQRAGHAPDLAPLAVQYADYAAWQRAQLGGEPLRRLESFWRKQLAGAPTLLTLPAGRPRPPVQLFRGASLPVVLQPPLTAALRRLCQQEQATLFMGLLTGLAALLARLSGQRDLLIGSPIAGRDHPDTQNLIGFFVNTLVLRADLRGNPTGREALRRMREVCLAAYDHQDLPFDRLVELLQVERSPSYPPLTQVVLSLQNTPAVDLRLDDLLIRPAEYDEQTAKFDLNLSLGEEGDRLTGHIEYDTGLFDRASVEQLFGRFERVLEALVNQPDRPISALPLLAPDERAALLERWSAPHAPAAPECLHDWFTRQAARTPEAVAVEYEDTRLTYAELDRRANQLAHHLRSLGVGPEVPVGMLLERSCGLIVALLGILKAGGAYVPLDPAAPRDRLALILDDIDTSVVLTTTPPDRPVAGHQDLLGGGRRTLVDLAADAALIARAPEHAPASGASPENLAYVIYTSGSTGRPKGSLITHAMVARLFTATDAWFGFGPQDVWTLFHSIAFDFSVWELWGALLYGGRLVVVPYLLSRAPDQFARLLRTAGVTVLNQTPSAFYQLIHADAALPPDLPPPALRRVIFGGEALDPLRLRPWFARYGDQRPVLINMYGITETTVHVTYRPLRQADAEQASSVLGRPIPDLQLYVLDEHLEPVPPGVTGELYVGGLGVARGYHARPDLTAERFIPNPFGVGGAGGWGLPAGEENGEPRTKNQEPDDTSNSKLKTQNSKLYKTGDLARVRADGELEYQGRSDLQVKIRGFRIELGEIEAALLAHPAVREAVLLAREDAPGERRLVAYVVLTQEPRTKNQEPDTDDAELKTQTTKPNSPEGEQLKTQTSKLRTHLQGRLPDYMLPAAFVLLERLPLTVNGKLDRAALPAPSGLREQHEQDLTPPRTPAEAAMAEIWAQVLQLDRVGIHDHFFALGGDSIRSVQVLARARERGLAFSLPQLFQHPTVAGLCEQLQTAQAQEAAADLAPFALIAPADRAALPDGVEDAYPLSALQQGMLFHSSANPSSGVYHDLFSFRLSAPYHPDALRQALRDLAAVHPILRTGFELARFSEPLQLVYRRAEPPLEIADLRHLPPAESEAAVRRWHEADRLRGFDWQSAPLLRFQIHLHADGSLQLSLAFHHAVLDGWSVSALLTELIRRYLQIVRGDVQPLPAPPLAFRAFVASEQAALRSHEHQTFWRDHLAGAEPIRLPQLAARAYERPDQLPVRHTHTLSADLTAALQRVCQQQGVPLKTVLLAAHLRVLALLGGRDEALGAVVMHGRPDTLGSEHALGLFLQTVPLRLSLRGHTWAGLVRATWQAEQTVQRFAHYPLAHIQRLAGGPLFEILFNFVHFHLYRQIAQIDDIQVLGDGGYERTNFPLGVTFAPDDAGAIDMNLAGTSELLGKAQLQQISAYYLRALEALVAHTDQDCLADSLLDPSEQALLTHGWGQASQGLPPEQHSCLHELFAAQAARTPGATALVCAGRHLTYDELDRRANGLATLLRRHGVGPEMRVGIFADRSPEQIIALLAVLKAGGAYLPLDPDYPPERLAMMLDDAGALLVLAQAPLAPRLPASRPVILLDEQTLAERASPPAGGAAPGNLAYVLYTSGSTGRPKGVAVEHRAVHNLAAALDATVYAGLPARPLRISLNGPLSFDTSVKQLVQLLRGHTLEIVPRDIRLDAAALSVWLQERAIDVFDCTPSQLRLLLDAGLGTYPRCVLVGGEAIDPQLWQELAANPERRCYNLYGPTECTVDTTTAPIAGASPTLGHPIPGAQLYVLDQAMRPVPAGVPGELYIGGAGVARGYHGRPDLTAERFVPNPFGVGGAGGRGLGAGEEHQEPRAKNQEPAVTTGASGNSKLKTQNPKLYKSGDLVRWLPGGTLEFLGRVDQQVKLRGHRIELSEIEAVLRQHPDVQTAAVLLREDTPGDQRLVAYLVPSEERRTENGEPGVEGAELKTQTSNLNIPEGEQLKPQTSKLKTLLQEQLPGYMVPSAYVWLGALPLNPNGKLDRRALPAPPSGQTVEQEAQLPRDQLELELARAWEELLGVAPVGIHDDFFALGGHSLLAMRLAKRIEGIGGAPFPLAALLQGATVARIAARLRDGRPIAASPLVALQPQGDRPPLFLVHPGGGGAFCYLALAAALGQRQPLYAFQSPALAETTPRPRDVPTLAASYIELMRQRQPDGPYRLGGWSFGGVVAFEMAQQIRAQGGEVALLALLDARLPDSDADPHDDLWLLIAFVQDLGLPLEQLDLDPADLGSRTPDELLALALEQGRRAQVIPEELALDDLRRLLLIFKQNRAALDSYRPHAYGGTLTLFQATQSGRYSPDDPSGGWGGLASAIELHPVDSDHFALVRPPHVQTVAAALAAALGHSAAAETPA